MILSVVTIGCAGCSGADGAAPVRSGPSGSGVAASFESPPIALERADIDRVARRAIQVRYNIDRPGALPPDGSQDAKTQVERTLEARAAGYLPSVHAAINEVYEPNGPDAAVLRDAADHVVATPQPSSVSLGGDVRDWRTISVDVGAGTGSLEATYTVQKWDASRRADGTWAVSGPSGDYRTTFHLVKSSGAWRVLDSVGRKVGGG